MVDVGPSTQCCASITVATAEYQGGPDTLEFEAPKVPEAQQPSPRLSEEICFSERFLKASAQVSSSVLREEPSTSVTIFFEIYWSPT